MIPKKKPSKKLLLRLTHKTNMRLIIAGSCVIVLSAILVIYFNMARVEEMKARGNSNNIPIEKPVDLNISKIQIDSSAVTAKYKIAKPLQQTNPGN
jgi:hypothetical protein